MAWYGEGKILKVHGIEGDKVFWSIVSRDKVLNGMISRRQGIHGNIVSRGQCIEGYKVLKSTWYCGWDIQKKKY